MVLRAVLFDLDGTLLDIALDGFLREYFAALGPTLSGIDGSPEAREIVAAVVESTNVMCAAHPGQTNREVFHAHFARLTGLDLDEPSIAEHVERFYWERFPLLKRDYGPRAGGVGAVRSARAGGLLTALATNPIFPRAAIDERMRWANLDQDMFEVVTSYETMHACKPDAAYFEQVAAMLGVDPSECLMVGDDAALDMPAAEIGMRTYYVGLPARHGADWAGTFEELAALVGRLAG